MFTGEAIRHLRNLKGLKQMEVASRLHISQPAYSKLEKRKEINGEVAEQIKNIFNCTDAEIEFVEKILQRDRSGPGRS